MNLKGSTVPGPADDGAKGNLSDPVRVLYVASCGINNTNATAAALSVSQRGHVLDERHLLFGFQVVPGDQIARWGPKLHIGERQRVEELIGGKRRVMTKSL